MILLFLIHFLMRRAFLISCHIMKWMTEISFYYIGSVAVTGNWMQKLVKSFVVVSTAFISVNERSAIRDRQIIDARLALARSRVKPREVSPRPVEK